MFDILHSLIWAVGYKVYPKRGWLPVLSRFYNQHRINHLVALPILLSWAKEGKKYPKELREEWAMPNLDEASSVDTHSTWAVGGLDSACSSMFLRLSFVFLLAYVFVCVDPIILKERP